MFNLRLNLLNVKRSFQSHNRCFANVFDVDTSGEKTVVNKQGMNYGGRREPWQRVRYKGREPELKLIKNIERSDRLCVDPRDSRSIAARKFQSLKDSLKERGFSREMTPFNPPSNAVTIIESIYNETFGNERTDDWQNASFSDTFIKFKFLKQCSKEFNYDIPNSSLHLMRKVSDVITFYTTPIRGVNPYDQLVRNSDDLPLNLSVIPEPIRYNPDHDPRFGGVNAYPHNALQVTGLRAKKKYPSFRKTFQWPDV